MSTQVAVNTNKPASKGNIYKFIIFSIIGIIIFFVPLKFFGITDSKIGEKQPIVQLVDICKLVLGKNAQYIATISSIVLFTTYVLSKVTDNKKLKKFHETDSNFYGFLYLLAAIFPIMVLFNIGPEPIVNIKVGGEALRLASTVMLTTFLAGWLVIFLMKSGIVEFVGVLIEPLMRPLFKLPGEAAVNALTAFVSAPAVGVFFTNKLYQDNIYTQKETIAVITNFSVCSIGFFGVLVGIGGIEDYYATVVLTTLIITFIMGAIVIRIPPISFKKNVYLNGQIQTKELLKEKEQKQANESRFNKALNIAVERSSEISLQSIFSNLVAAAKFTQKIVAFVIAVATLTLLVVEYTQVFDILGKPMIPYLQLLGIKNAEVIAPSTIIGITDMILPVTLLSGKGVEVSSIFFIVVLSAVQIIFFTGSATAMLELDVPLKPWELIVMFLLRTVIAMPIIAVVTNILF